MRCGDEGTSRIACLRIAREINRVRSTLRAYSVLIDPKIFRALRRLVTIHEPLEEDPSRRERAQVHHAEETPGTDIGHHECTAANVATSSHLITLEQHRYEHPRPWWYWLSWPT